MENILCFDSASIAAIAAITSSIITLLGSYILRKKEHVHMKTIDEQLIAIKNIYGHVTKINRKISKLDIREDKIKTEEKNNEISKLLGEYIDYFYSNQVLLNENITKKIEELNRELFNSIDNIQESDLKSRLKAHTSLKNMTKILNEDLKKEFKDTLGKL